MRKRRKKSRRIKKGGILRITILALVIIFSYSSIYQYKIEKKLMGKKLAIQAEIEQISMEIEELEKDIEESQTLRFIEKTARDDYKMIKPREIIYIVEDKDEEITEDEVIQDDDEIVVSKEIDITNINEGD